MSDQSYIQLIAQQLRQDREAVQQRKQATQTAKAGRPSLVVSPWVLLALGVLGYTAKPQAAELSEEVTGQAALPVEPTAVLADAPQELSLRSLLDGADLNVAAPSTELSLSGNGFAERLAAFDAQESLFRDALDSGVSSVPDSVDSLFAQATDGWPRYPSTSSGAGELHAQAPSAASGASTSGAASTGAATSGAASGAAAGTAATGAAGATAAATAATAAGAISAGAVLGGVALVGVAVAGGSDSSSTPAVASSSGYVVKGPLQDVVVFRDADADMIWDSTEQITLTNDKGAYTLLGSGGTIVATSDVTADMLAKLNKTSLTPVDTSITDATAKVFKGVLAAPAGATVVTPLTTLLAASDPTLSGTALTAKATQLASALGLTTSGSGAIDILTFNPFASGADATKALAAEKAAVQVSTVLTAIADAVDRVGGDAVNIGQAVKVVAGTLATKVADVASGSTIDLADSTTLASIKTGVSTAVTTSDATKAGFAGGESTVLTSVVTSSLTTVATTNAAVQAVTLDVAAGASASATATALTTALTSVATNLATAKTSLTSAVSSNHAPTVSSTPVAAQTATQDQAFSFTLPTDLFADQDGLNTLTYVASLANGNALPSWLSFDATSKTLSGTPVNADVNKYGTTDNYISVRVSAIDTVGARADATIKVSVANVNDAPTGSVTITGTPTQNQTLTAANTLADVDAGTGTISYQWYAGDAAITGATSSTLVLAQAQVGKAISVKASYTDGYGAAESKTSVATTAVANVNDAPTGSVTIAGTVESGQTLTASNTLADIDGLGTITYSWYASGVTDPVGTGATFRIPKALFDKTLTVKASYTDEGGQAESVSSAATVKVTGTNSPAIGSVSLTTQSASDGNGFKQGDVLTMGGFFVTDEDNVTTTNTTGVVSSTGLTYQWYANDTAITDATSGTFTLTESQVGKAIKLKITYTDALSQSNSIFTDPTLAIANVNDATTGAVTITGTATQGQTLTASNTLADADGMGTVSYFWKADGLGIAGVTGNTLALTEPLVGKAITVTASYTDGHGTVESKTSSATAAVANVNDAPTGSVTIAGTATSGQTLTASNDIADADGVGTIGYQWYADSTAISGATSSTFVLTNDQAGKAVTVKASYTDGHSTAETVTSTATSAVKGLYSGTSNAETLVGSAVADVINGAGGNDTITGGGGADTITLGTGNAVVKFVAMTDSTASASDVISGFNTGDKISLADIIGANGGSTGGYTGEQLMSYSASSPVALTNWKSTPVTGTTNTKYSVDIESNVDLFVGVTGTKVAINLDFDATGVTSIGQTANDYFDLAVKSLKDGVASFILATDADVSSFAKGSVLATITFTIPTATAFEIKPIDISIAAGTYVAPISTPLPLPFSATGVKQTAVVVNGTYSVVEDTGSLAATVGDNEIHFYQSSQGAVEVRYDTNKASGSTTQSAVLHFEGVSTSSIDLSKTDFIFS